MIIKRLSASFGRLNNDTLTLAAGLNIIQAPNESGKSTWCAFIKAMLYGVRTSERDKKDYLSAKTKFAPWNGAPMTGAMDINVNGQDVTIERTGDTKSPMKHFTAVLTGTGEPYAQLHPETAGETLAGLSEDVFERSVFVSQAGVRVGQTPELEKRIASLVSTGDETVSYTETDALLRKWLRKRRHNKIGVIPQLEEELRDIGEKLSHIETALDEAAALRQETENLQARRDELSDELRRWDRYDAQMKVRRARDKYEHLHEAYDKIYKELTINGHVPSTQELADIRSDLRVLEQYRTQRDNEQQRVTEHKTTYERLLGQRNASPFNGRESARDVEDAAELARTLQKNAFNAVSVVILLLTLACVVMAALMPDWRLYAAAAAVGGAAFMIWKVSRYRNQKGKLRTLLSVGGAESPQALRTRYEDYKRLLSELGEAQSAYKASEKTFYLAAENYRTVRKELAEKLAAAGLFPEPENAARELTRVESLLERLSTAKSDMHSAASVLDELHSSTDDQTVETGDVPPPAADREELSARLADITARLERVKNQYNMTLGEVRALGDPVVLGSRRRSAEAELAEQRAQYDALSLAVQTLGEANTELQSRFSPLLGETAGRIMNRLTAGRYQKLAFDKSLNARAQTKDEPVNRDVLALSTGTSDQIYLALRLAVSELILPAGNTCPLILDDTLCNFDEDRAALALDFLNELARTRQILLFTCHAREAAYLRDNPNVRHTTL